MATWIREWASNTRHEATARSYGADRAPALESPYLEPELLVAPASLSVPSSASPASELGLEALAGDSPFVAVSLQETPLEEHEFRVDRLPAPVRAQFKPGAVWVDVLGAAIGAGIRDANQLANLVFYSQHPERISAQVGRRIAPPSQAGEPDFFKLRAEWFYYKMAAEERLRPGTCSVFLPEQKSTDYERFVSAATTGRMELMPNGRTTDTTGKSVSFHRIFDSMQLAVEALSAGDSLYLAAWQFIPTELPLTLNRSSAGLNHWGDLLVNRAKAGVKIRVIVSELRPFANQLMSDLDALESLAKDLGDPVRDNFKYIVSRHSATGSHHQKFMVLRKGQSAVGFCGGLDVSRNRTAVSGTFVWHDVHTKVEGRIVRDLEREFVLRWNRQKADSVVKELPGWKPFENLPLPVLTSDDKESAKNQHRIQMVRTVTTGQFVEDIRRDDIWQSYFRLIACARSFIFIENQYFHERMLAEAIVRHALAHPSLVVLVAVSSGTDDAPGIATDHGRALRREALGALSKLPKGKLGLYTIFPTKGLLHSKLMLVDDRALSVGSLNTNPRGFFLDSELNLVLDDPAAVKSFRHEIWAHDLGVGQATVASWGVSDFIAKWDAIAKANAAKTTLAAMSGAGVIPFDPNKDPGRRSRFVRDVWL